MAIMPLLIGHQDYRGATASPVGSWCPSPSPGLRRWAPSPRSTSWRMPPAGDGRCVRRDRRSTALTRTSARNCHSRWQRSGFRRHYAHAQVRDAALQDRAARRDHHPEPTRAPQHDRAADARRDRDCHRPCRTRLLDQGDRASRRRPLVLGWLRLRRRLPALGRCDEHRRPLGSRQGLRAHNGARHQSQPEVHGDLAGLQTRHRSDPRLVRRRRKRLRAVRRHHHRQRRRRHRHAVRPHVGRLPHRHVAVPPEPGEGEMAFADRRAADRKGSRRSRTHQRVRAVRAPRSESQRDRGQARQDPGVPAAGPEAHRQPGLREHGPLFDPDARKHPRRVDAQHPRRPFLHRNRCFTRGSDRDRTA